MLDMNPDVRAQWCAALRSGDYPQTAEALRRLPGEREGFPEGYCCLGVLTALWLKAGHEEMIPDPYWAGEQPPLMVSVWANPEGVLSRPVMEWAGLTDPDPLIRQTPHSFRQASNLNDDHVPFAGIADLIDGGAA